MSFRGLLRPGQGFKPFTVYRRAGVVAHSGRPATGKLEAQSEFFGIITQASPTEKEQWKQSGHPITHTIVQRGSADNAVETDVLELNDGSCCKRRFLVKSVQDPGELGHFLIYKVEERVDLK